MTIPTINLTPLLRAVKDGLPSLSDAEPRDRLLAGVVLAAAAAYALGVRLPRPATEFGSHAFRRSHEWFGNPHDPRVVDVPFRVT